MKGKYTNPIKYAAVKARRALLRTVLRPLLRWAPLERPQPGYSVIIGCNWQLAAMVGADLRMLVRQERQNLRSIIIVIDRPKDHIAVPVEENMRKRYPELPLEFVYYKPMQARVLGTVNWGWAYAWLSWSIGISRCCTQHALLQDFDAMLLRPDALEERYRTIVEQGDQYLGIAWYEGNGMELEDRVVKTPELMFDAAYVRQHFRPIDLFNHVTTHNGRTVDFDTFLYAQAKGGRKAVIPLAEEDMVHPSQMICQFTHLMAGRGTLSPDRNNLLLVPYFMYLGGEEAPLRDQLAALQRSDSRTVAFFGRELRIDGLRATHLAWMRKQALQLEVSLHGSVRVEVEAYLDAIEQAVGQKVKVAA